VPQNKGLQQHFKNRCTEYRIHSRRKHVNDVIDSWYSLFNMWKTPTTFRPCPANE